MDKLEAFTEYLKSPLTCYDWHGEELNLTLEDLDLVDLEGFDRKDELEKAFLAGVKWAQGETK